MFQSLDPRGDCPREFGWCAGPKPAIEPTWLGSVKRRLALSVPPAGQRQFAIRLELTLFSDGSRGKAAGRIRYREVLPCRFSPVMRFEACLRATVHRVLCHAMASTIAVLSLTALRAIGASVTAVQQATRGSQGHLIVAFRSVVCLGMT